MAGVLIAMRAAILRRNASGKRALGGLALALLVTALAVGTLWAGLIHYRYSGAGTNVLATLCFGWLLGWVTGPLLAGDDATLRMDYFKLLPIPARTLARALLTAAFANVSLVFSLIAFAGLIAYGAQFDAVAALIGAVALVLYLVLAVVASTVAIAVFGPVISSRRGRDFGTTALALVITLLSVASGLVPFVASRLTDGHSPGLAALVRILPSGWGAVATQAAGQSRWGLMALSLGGQVVLIAVLVLAWPPLLARRLTMAPGGSRTRTHPTSGNGAGTRRPLLPATPLGAVIAKELRLYSRSVLRSVMLMISFLTGVFVCVIPALGGNTALLPFAGLLFTGIAASCFTNLYGDDGTSLWLTVTTPGAARPDLRGRQWAWFAVVGPPGLLLTLVFTAITGQARYWPWALACEPALLLGCVGLLPLISVLSVNGPSADGGPSPARVLKTHIALIAVPAAALWPALALLIPGTIAHLTWLQWLAVPVGIGCGALLGGQAGRAALGRLERREPEIFARVRAPVVT